jgi:hypothetical protein
MGGATVKRLRLRGTSVVLADAAEGFFLGIAGRPWPFGG